MPSKKELKSLLKKRRKPLYRDFFRKKMGNVVLGDILGGPCRFFGRIDEYDLGFPDPVSDGEMFIRQQVGWDILSAFGVVPNRENSKETAETFVDKLLTVRR